MIPNIHFIDIKYKPGKQSAVPHQGGVTCVAGMSATGGHQGVTLLVLDDYMTAFGLCKSIQIYTFRALLLFL